MSQTSGDPEPTTAPRRLSRRHAATQHKHPDTELAKAERAVEGKAPVKRNRFIKLTGATKSVNRDLEAKARALAGWKGYTSNLAGQPAEFVIDVYHQLWRIEKSFRMSKHDLQARPVLPPHPRLDRSPPDDRVRRPGRQPLD